MITDDQRKSRVTGIFSSDTPRIAAGDGVKVYLEKVGDLPPEDIGEIDYVALGNLLEPVVLNAFIELPIARDKIEISPDTVRSKDHPWLGAHLDALLPDAVVEAKVVGAYNKRHWGEPGTDCVPDRVLWQVQHQMAVTGRRTAFVPVCFADEANLTGFMVRRALTIEVYEVSRSETMIKHLITEGGKVWEGVCKRIPPVPATVADARILYANETPGAIEATPIIAAMVEARKDLDRRQAQLEHEIDEVTTTLMGYMKEATDLRYSGATLATWRKAKDAEVIDVKALRKQMPGIADQFTIARPGARRFLVK